MSLIIGKNMNHFHNRLGLMAGPRFCRMNSSTKHYTRRVYSYADFKTSEEALSLLRWVEALTTIHP